MLKIESQHDSQTMFQPISYLRALSLIWSLVICPVSVLLLMSCVTLDGAIFAIGALLLGLAPSLALINPEHGWLRRSAVISFSTWFLITIWLIFHSPDGSQKSGARVQNRYVGDVYRYQTHSLGALLPEVDQFMLGFRLVPFVDPLLTFDQIRPLAADTRAIYSELESDTDFHALGSVMPDAYNELWNRPFDHGHYFLYVPPSLNRKAPAPAMVFLHGSGGNFKSYIWLLSRVADERGMVLIAPSFGFGNWDARTGSRAVTAALDDAAKVVSLDKRRVHLAGLSNGGLGVSRVTASELGGGFRTLIFLSPVCDDHALASPTFADHCHEKPVLIITGEDDNRVPVAYVKECAATMRKAGAAVDMSTYANANHFLFFNHRERCLKELSSWLAKQNDVTPPFSKAE